MIKKEEFFHNISKNIILLLGENMLILFVFILCHSKYNCNLDS